MSDRHHLNDEQWQRLQGLLPDGSGRAGRPWSDHRMVIDGVLHRVRTGCPWRDLPERYGPWKTVYNRHRTWSGDGTWERIVVSLTAGSVPVTGEFTVGVDSTVVRAHQHAAGAPTASPRDVAEDRLRVFLEDGAEPGPSSRGCIERQESGLCGRETP